MGLSPYEGFKSVLWVMLFYSVAINIIIYSLPAGAINYADFFTDTIDESNLNYNSITADVQSGLDQQSNVPLIEVGALVFYSGNILVDLILNFVTAIPQMIGLLINGITSLFGNGIDATVLGLVQGFATAAVTIFYILGLINLTTGIRSGRVI